MNKSTPQVILGICLILSGALIPVLAKVVAQKMPLVYKSAVTIEVKSNASMVTAYSGSAPASSPGPGFIATQIQILQSKAILYPVIDELGLVDKWSAGLPAKLTREDAYEKLFKMMKVSEKPGTDMLIVAVGSPDRQEAADIANTIVVIYQRQSRDDIGKQIARALAELNAKVEKQRDDMNAAKAELETIRARDNIQDPNPEYEVSPSGTAPAAPFTPDYLAAKKKYLDAKRLLDSEEAKFASEKMELTIELVPVKIWDRAVPARFPSGTNGAHVMMAADSLGFLCAICGLALIIMALCFEREGDGSCNLKSEI